MKKQKVFIIGGPTASGKSALAIQLAQHFKSCVVNGDSIQVYKDLRLLSARPNETDEQQVPHHLFGYVDAWTTPSITDWLEQIEQLIPTVENPVIVGGTGMYLNALTEGVSPVPEISNEIRQLVRQMPLEEVRSRMKAYPYQDSQRIRRALEVLLSTGKELSYFHHLPKKKYINADVCLIHVLPPREKVYQSCEKRFEIMIKEGAIEEVARLNELKATGGVLKAIGVPEIRAYLKSDLSKQEMIQKAVIATRQYAKRQMTWFRHHGRPNVVVTNIADIKIEDITK